jgi:hypothetical protein
MLRRSGAPSVDREQERRRDKSSGALRSSRGALPSPGRRAAATMPPSSPNSAGPIRAGSEGAGGMADSQPGHRVGATGNFCRVLDGCSLTGRGVMGSDFHLAMARAQTGTCIASAMPGNSHRNSTTAANSPCCSKSVQTAAASSSANARGQTRQHRLAPFVKASVESPSLPYARPRRRASERGTAGADGWRTTPSFSR